MPNGSAAGSLSPEDTAERQAIRTLGALLNESLVKIAQAEQSSLISMMGVVAVLASLPEMEKVDPNCVGAMVGALVRGRPDEEAFRTKVANAAARIITVAQQSRAALPPKTEIPQAGSA
jgi:hypothetical protein